MFALDEKMIPISLDIDIPYIYLIYCSVIPPICASPVNGMLNKLCTPPLYLSFSVKIMIIKDDGKAFVMNQVFYAPLSPHFSFFIILFLERD